MNGEIRELYDYDLVRRQNEPTMFVSRLSAPTLVLGSRQSLDVLTPSTVKTFPLRRRRGGGGLVLLQPNDLWIDWWIPANDARWSGDVRVSALTAGQWWRQELALLNLGDVVVYDGPLEGDEAHRFVCFAGRGPGEVFVNGQKAVGLTQWRMREGIFLSTVVHSTTSRRILDLVRAVPPGLGESLEHHTRSTLGIEDSQVLVTNLSNHSGPWLVREHILN